MPAISTRGRERRWRCCGSASASGRGSSRTPSWPTCSAFAAPRALGVSLRVAGLVEGGDRGVELLGESVDVAPRLARAARARALAGRARRRPPPERPARGRARAARRGARPRRPLRCPAADPARARGAQRHRCPPPPRVAYRSRGADPERAARRSPRDRGPVQPRDRARAVRDAEDRGGPPLARVREARRSTAATSSPMSCRKRQGCRPSSERRPASATLAPRRRREEARDEHDRT